MGILSAHNPNEADPYLRPPFGTTDKLARLLWQATWTLLCRFTPNPLHRWRAMVLRVFGARLGRSNFVYPSARIWAPWLLETGDVVTIGSRAEIYNPGGVLLSHHCIVSQDALLCGATHNHNDPGFPFVSKRIVLEPYSWVCARAIVLPGLTLGSGSVLGAGGVATRSLPPWSVWAGNPARHVGERAHSPD